MASHLGVRTPSLSLRHGIRCITQVGITVEDVLLDVAERVGHENIISASRMNKAVVVFLKEELLVNRLVESGIVVSGAFVIVQPLISPTVKVVISNVPPFIPDEDIQRELLRYGKFASGIKMIPLGCKNESLKHVLSFRRQVFMFLNAPTLNVSFRCVYEGKSYMLYANAGELRCYDCGAVGHVRLTCPQREEVTNETDTNGSAEQTMEEKVENEDQNVLNNKDLGSVGAESESNNTEVSTEVVENVNGEIELIEEMVMKETEKNTEQVEKVEHGEEVMSVDRDQSSNRSIVNSEGKNSEERIENEGEEESDDDLSDVSDVSNLSQMGGDQFYALEEIDAFLDETFGKVAEVKDYFTDTKKFESSALYWMKRVGEDKLSRRKRYRLRKFVTKIRGGKAPKKRKFK